ncbi:hypothetical protein BD410DRAFT_290710 [Rickenella mellea]|uniref:Uncharacterized protein n=1 Tax=Rickenella mellea TaxID=50990 RepID=A0A4Y7Q293_9AGAM|nr:hypothetical protein BD410DRAFT_290710 [Rickenella mellea]
MVAIVILAPLRCRSWTRRLFPKIHSRLSGSLIRLSIYGSAITFGSQMFEAMPTYGATQVRNNMDEDSQAPLSTHPMLYTHFRLYHFHLPQKSHTEAVPVLHKFISDIPSLQLTMLWIMQCILQQISVLFRTCEFQKSLARAPDFLPRGNIG